MRLAGSADNRRKQTTAASSSNFHSLSTGSWEQLMPHYRYLTSSAAPAWLFPAAIVLLTVAAAAAVVTVAWHWHQRRQENQHQQQPATGGGSPNGSRSLWEDAAHWRRQRGARARQAVHVAAAACILAQRPFPGRPFPEWEEQRARRELDKVRVTL